MKVKVNSSFMHLIKARMIKKLGIKIEGENEITFEEGEHDGLPFVKLNNKRIFYHPFLNDPISDIFSRYVYSHYEINKKPNKKYGIGRSHIDNLLSLKVNFETRDFLLKNMPIKSGDTILELGAFCGFGTMKLSELVGPTGKVIAVEADKSNFKFLSKNIQDNNIKNVLTVNTAISNTQGKAKFYKEHNQRNSIDQNLLDNVEEIEEIECNSVDNILQQMNIQHVDFITMEINAAEVDALRGMSSTLKQKNLRLVSAGWYDFEGKPEWISMKNILENLGYSVYIGVQNRVFAIKR